MRIEVIGRCARDVSIVRIESIPGIELGKMKPWRRGRSGNGLSHDGVSKRCFEWKQKRSFIR